MTSQIQKRKIHINGREFDSIQSAARAFGLSRNTVDYRLSKGWTPEQAVGLEPRPSHAGRTAGIPVIVQGREFKTIKEAAKHFGRSYTYVFARLNDGCSIEQALGLVKRTDTFQSEYPELAKEWHPTKNGSLTPNSVTPHSGQKVWWLCPYNHEWPAVINSRSRGTGCPYCALHKRTGRPYTGKKRTGRKPSADWNLATEYPELAKEWDLEKNGYKTPEKYSPRSPKKVWWRCATGHSWQATISNRTRRIGGACPCCLNLRLCEGNSLAEVRPDIAEDWHPIKNAPLTPSDVVAGGTKKVWWRCKHGHEWRTTIGLRVSRGTGCPKCSLQTSRIEIAIYSELSVLFNVVDWREKIAGYECDILLHDRSIGVEIDGVYWHSRRPEQELVKSAAFEEEGIQLFRLREDGLPVLSERDVSFKSSEDAFLVISRLANSLLKYALLTDAEREKLHDYINGSGLVNEKLYRKLVAMLPAPPPGQSLADKQPEIAKQWAYDLNAPLSPEHFRHQANKKVWWRCPNGHTWKVSINNRTQHGTGCPDCPRPRRVVTDDRNLAVLSPDLASEWHPEKNGNLRPDDVRPMSNEKIWWLCSKGHEWPAIVASRTSGSGCPYCYGRFASKENNLASKYPDLLEEWDHEKNKALNPSDFTPHVGKKVWWRCKKKHSWQATIYNRTKNKSGCPACARENARKYTIEDMQALAKERGGQCLNTQYTSSRDKLEWRCEEGHAWEARVDGILYQNKWCPECARKR